jgi:hypothetical protein
MTSSQGEPPLTRRQLREMERAQEAAAQGQVAEAATPATPVESPAVADKAPASEAPASEAPVSESPAPAAPTSTEPETPRDGSFDSLLAADPAHPSFVEENTGTSSGAAAQPGASTWVTPAPSPAAPSPAASSAAPADDATPLGRRARRALADDHAADDASPTTEAAPVAAAPVAAGITDAAPATEPEPTTGPRTLQPPTGHWSIAANAPDDEDEAAPPLSRNVLTSGTVTATNALILPSIPSADATAPLTSTGEILVTGSIDLPRSLGSTGHQPHGFDSADMDRMYEQAEAERPSTDATPIRAASAVSATSESRGPITPPKNRGTRLPTILSITAGVLAAAVLGLLAAGYFFKVF